MELPKVGHTYNQERRGIAALQSYAATAGQIWRETDTGDVGIDGQLEFVASDGFATGRLVAVQVKAGPSFFRHPSPSGWRFYPEEKHRNYWERFPLPVLLIMHDPETEQSFWVDARQALRVHEHEDRPFVEVPSENVLETTAPSTLFENAGVLAQPFIPSIADVLNAMITTVWRAEGFLLSYFDLFTYGLTNRCRSIYYGMDIILSAVENNLSARTPDVNQGIGLDALEHEFAFDFVKFLLAQNLAHIDYADCLVDWMEYKMHPQFVAPLTSRGRSLVALIHNFEDLLTSSGVLEIEGGSRVAQEGVFEMLERSYSSRCNRIRRFQEVFSKADQ